MPVLASMSRATAPVLAGLVLLSLAFGTGCNSHVLTGPDAGPQIAENGISVPIPPPSLKLAPVQRVDIEGELGSTSEPKGGTVYLREVRRGLPGQFVAPELDGSFFFEGVELDLTDNCIEIWSEDADAMASVHSFYTASIADDDQSVITEQLFNGC